MIEFDSDFASPMDYAKLYRSLGWQSVPARMPTSFGTWKRPAVDTWKHLTDELVTDEDFETMFNEKLGDGCTNVGIITGRCSGKNGESLVVVDIDEQTHLEATRWWEAILEKCNGSREFETPTQKTGGGGRQVFFRAPADWTPPTGKSAIGVDIRGQGGFVMAPPSQHLSGERYDWLPDYEPWNVPAMMIPAELAGAIMDLLGTHEPTGAHQTGAEPIQRADTPAYDRSLAGELLDGREKYMAQMIWASVVDLYRESPVLPPDLPARLKDVFDCYCRNAKSRINEPGTPNHILLEREGRGITAFSQRWKHAIGHWDTKVAKAAALPSPNQRSGNSAITDAIKAVTMPSGVQVDPTTGEVVDGFATSPDALPVLNEAEIDALPDPEWVIKGLVIERALGFIYGRPGSGKSFVALDIAMRCAYHMPDWFGRDIVRNGPVVYLSCEGVSDIKDRLSAWRIHHKVERGDQFYLAHDTINFMAETDVAKVLRAIQSVRERSGATPALVFVDTVSRVLPGADENLQKDMTLFIKACDAIREAFGCAVVGVHHTSRQGNLRGSTVFDGAGDFLLSVEREEDSKTGVLHATKVKAAADGWRVGYELRLAPTGALRGTESLVVVPVELAEVQGSTAVLADRRIVNEALEAMRVAWESGNPWSTSEQTRTQGRFVIDRLRAYGLTKEAATKMIGDLFNSGCVVEEMVDKKTRRMGIKVVKIRTTESSFG